jgi:hypothetical protein
MSSSAADVNCPNTPSMSPSIVETNPSISLLGNTLLVRADEGRTLRAFGHAIVRTPFRVRLYGVGLRRGPINYGSRLEGVGPV